MILIGAGCAQNKVADDKGNHFNARHRAIGSHIPAPDRAGGSDDTSAQSLDQQAFQQQNDRANAGAGGFGSMSGRGTR